MTNPGTTPKPGDIVLVSFPFTDQSAIKPAIATIELTLVTERTGC